MSTKNISGHSTWPEMFVSNLKNWQANEIDIEFRGYELRSFRTGVLAVG
jgi:hypothetical protein